MQPLFGFMCTLDPLGYTASQYYTLPFLVLYKALQSNIYNATESNTKVLELVQDTCTNMILSDEILKEQIIE